VIGLLFVSILRAGKGTGTDRFWLERVCLAGLFLMGAVLGYVCALRCAETSAEELLVCLDGYRRLFSQGGEGTVSLFSAARLYFVHVLLLFVLGFVPLGTFLIPVVAVEYGFSAMFAVACMLCVYGRDGLAMALGCMGLRLLVTLPCVLWLGAHGWARSAMRLPRRKGKRAAAPEGSGAYVLRFVVCCVLLLIGISLERSVTYKALSWLMALG